jgi:hypothetical protein
MCYLYRNLTGQFQSCFARTRREDIRNEEGKDIKVVFRGKYNKEFEFEFIQKIFSQLIDRFSLFVCSSHFPDNFARLKGIEKVTEKILDVEMVDIISHADLAV